MKTGWLIVTVAAALGGAAPAVALDVNSPTIQWLLYADNGLAPYGRRLTILDVDVADADFLEWYGHFVFRLGRLRLIPQPFALMYRRVNGFAQVDAMLVLLYISTNGLGQRNL